MHNGIPSIYKEKNNAFQVNGWNLKILCNNNKQEVLSLRRDLGGVGDRRTKIV